MNKIAQRIADILGSAWFIIPFTLWTIIHNLFPFAYVNFISDVAIVFGSLILRAEAVQSERQERAVKEDVRLSKEVLKLLKKGK